MKKKKFVVKFILTIINILIILYLPMLNASGYNTLLIKLISCSIFIFFVFEFLINRKVKKELLTNIVFILVNLSLPIIIFFTVLQFFP